MPLTIVGESAAEGDIARIHYSTWVVDAPSLDGGSNSDDGEDDVVATQRDIDELSCDDVAALAEAWACSALVAPLRRLDVDGVALCSFDTVAQIVELAPDAPEEMCCAFLRGVIELRKHGAAATMLRAAGSGEPFDSTYARSTPYSFAVGRGEVIEGLDAAVAAMRVGERVDVLVEPGRAYGARGLPPRVPPNATLRLVVELLSISAGQGGRARSALAELEACAEEATQSKERGNAHFKAKAFADAISQYMKALSLLQLHQAAAAAAVEGGEEEEEEEDPERSALLRDAMKRTSLSCHLNLAACYIHTRAFALAIARSTAALTMDAHSVKALYRRAQASIALGDTVRAKSDLLAARQLEPQNASVLALVRKLKARKQKERSKAKKLFS